MIQTETIKIENFDFTHTWSDEGMKIERDGVRYSEAYDPADAGRVYTETDEPIQPDEEPTEEDYAEVGKILLGVEE